MDSQQNSDILRSKLELHLMRFYPDRYVPKYVKDIRDLYALRFYVREIRFTDLSFLHVLSIVFEAVNKNQRFRTRDCLRVVKLILRNKSTDIPFSAEIRDKLFFLYQHYIFHQNTEIQWAVSTYLKNEILSDLQIRWLIEHSSESIMILNRLLRYPDRNPHIAEWAKNVYLQHKHRNRVSELIAILIDFDIPEFVDLTNRSTILWAIYYAQINTETRKKLLKTYFDSTQLDEIIKICTRLGYVDVLEDIHSQL